ncbi:hypothetical protein J6590_093408 [Homalodisca vitripennis]|nr:hypothetical protein J6590_093408 [Homalodisca vitripennis]
MRQRWDVTDNSVWPQRGTASKALFTSERKLNTLLLTTLEEKRQTMKPYRNIHILPQYKEELCQTTE